MRYILPFLAAMQFNSVICCLLLAQSPAVSINPMRLEIELNAGASKTVSFEVQAAASNAPERGRLLLSLTDWTIKEDGSLTFLPSGSSGQSAGPWILFSPAAVTVEPGRVQMVRLTVTVPAKTPPGSYRSAVFLQERPPATGASPGQVAMFVRVRYTVIIHVIVPPASGHGDLAGLDVDTSQTPPRLIFDMTNTGNRHVRPVLVWNIKGAGQELFHGRAEATVLLPGAHTHERIPLAGVNLSPGMHEASVIVDFQDGAPQQAMVRAFEVQQPHATTPVANTEPDNASPAPEIAGQ